MISTVFGARYRSDLIAPNIGPQSWSVPYSYDLVSLQNNGTYRGFQKECHFWKKGFFIVLFISCFAGSYKIIQKNIGAGVFILPLIGLINVPILAKLSQAQVQLGCVALLSVNYLHLQLQPGQGKCPSLARLSSHIISRLPPPTP